MDKLSITLAILFLLSTMSCVTKSNKIIDENPIKKEHTVSDEKNAGKLPYADFDANGNVINILNLNDERTAIVDDPNYQTAFVKLMYIENKL